MKKIEKIDKSLEGMIFENYRKMCEYLGIPVKSGSAKSSQMKEIRSLAEIVTDGHKIKFAKIYDEALAIQDNRKEKRNSIYVDDISIQLLGYLSRNRNKDRDAHEQNGVFLTSNQIFFETGMMNEKYVPARSMIKELIKQSPAILTYDDIESFYKRTGLKMGEILKDTLKNLEGRFIIRWEKKHRIKEKDGDWRLATEKEEDLIMDVKKIVMDSMGGIQKFNHIVWFGRVNEFYAKVQIYLEENFNIEGCYSGYYIASGNELENAIKRYEKEIIEKKRLQLSLNGNIIKYFSDRIDKLYHSEKTEYDKEIDKIYFELEKQYGEIEYPKFRTKEEFENGQFFLFDELMKIK